MSGFVLEPDPADMTAVRTLFLEYAQSLAIDLCFQGFDHELATLPGLYAPPRGRLWLARGDGPGTRKNALAGCVGVRPLDAQTCEMKRLWVRPRYRGTGLGRRLVDATLAFAREAGYDRMRLDTLASMTRAQELYRHLGFREIAPYYDNPHPDVVFMECRVRGVPPLTSAVCPPSKSASPPRGPRRTRVRR